MTATAFVTTAGAVTGRAPGQTFARRRRLAVPTPGARRSGGSPRWTGCTACTPDAAPDNERTVEVDDLAPAPVSVETVPRTDPRLGRAGTPEDRVAAQAWSAFSRRWW